MQVSPKIDEIFKLTTHKMTPRTIALEGPGVHPDWRLRTRKSASASNGVSIGEQQRVLAITAHRMAPRTT